MIKAVMGLLGLAVLGVVAFVLFASGLLLPVIIFAAIGSFAMACLKDFK